MALEKVLSTADAVINFKIQTLYAFNKGHCILEIFTGFSLAIFYRPENFINNLLAFGGKCTSWIETICQIERNQQRFIRLHLVLIKLLIESLRNQYRALLYF